MGSWKKYIFSVVACVFICRIVLQIISDPKRKALLRLVSGTVLAVFILSPLSELDFEEILDSASLQTESSEYSIEAGEKIALEVKAEYIKSACEAYILDKAKNMGAEISVQIFLDENLIPQLAEIKGSQESDIQMQLQSILTDDLGIQKENQIWTWSRESNSS